MNQSSQTMSTYRTPPWQRQQWPLCECSSAVESGGVNWHVQQLGEGPTVLLLHGTGSSTHSWRELAKHLSTDYHIIMCDLPGHGFTSRPRNSMMSLTSMTRLIGGLLKQLNVTPNYVVGHSAGAALCCQLVLNKAVNSNCIVSINGALRPFNGIAGQVFAPLAQLLALNPVVPRLVNWRAKKDSLAKKLLYDTGSKIDAEGMQYYSHLLRQPEHVAGALSMMAQWDLVPFARQLPQLTIPLHLIVGANDKTVPPVQADEVKQLVAVASVHKLNALGHLAHEEQPEATANLLRELFELKTTLSVSTRNDVTKDLGGA